MKDLRIGVDFDVPEGPRSDLLEHSGKEKVTIINTVSWHPSIGQS